MNDKANLFSISIKSIVLITLFVSLLGMATSSSAVVIDFDDLNPVYDEYDPCWCDNPLTDQYLSKGLLIGGSWVNGGNSHNIMLTSNFGWLSFVGELPTFVSFFVTSEHDDAILFNASIADGSNIQKNSAGWLGSDEEYIPAIPNELITFTSELGIKGISIEGFYNLRTGAAIDNLTYTYASVPEPSSIILLGLGLIILTKRRYKKIHRFIKNRATE